MSHSNSTLDLSAFASVVAHNTVDKTWYGFPVILLDNVVEWLITSTPLSQAEILTFIEQYEFPKLTQHAVSGCYAQLIETFDSRTHSV